MPSQDIEQKAVLPVFVKANLVPEDTKVFNICQAAEEVAGPSTIDGATLISGLWRVYPLSENARLKLLTDNTVLGDKSFRFESFNPYVRRNGGKEAQGTRLIVSNLPFSYSNMAVEKNLTAAGYRLRSQLQFEKARDPQGFLTDWKTGRRFVYIDLPSNSMRNSLKMGEFTAQVFYREMRQNQKCFNCLQPGHRAAECPNEQVCMSCLQPGHRRGDALCGGEYMKVSNQLEDNEVQSCDDGKSDTSGEEDVDEKEEGELGDNEQEMSDDEQISNEGELQSDKGNNSKNNDQEDERNKNKEDEASVSSSEPQKIKEIEKTNQNETKQKVRDVDTPKGRTGKQKKKAKNNQKKKQLDTKSCLNQSSLNDFGIGNKRSIDQAHSPDGLTGSPSKKESKTKT